MLGCHLPMYPLLQEDLTNKEYIPFTSTYLPWIQLFLRPSFSKKPLESDLVVNCGCLETWKKII